MTEQEWLISDNFIAMLIYLRGVAGAPLGRSRFSTERGSLQPGAGTRVSESQLRKVALACCRKWREIPLDDQNDALISRYEQFLTGRPWHEFTEACLRLINGWPSIRRPEEWSLTPLGMAHLIDSLAFVIACTLHEDVIREREQSRILDAYIHDQTYNFPEFIATFDACCGLMPVWLRDIVGNPFRPTPLESRWITSTVVDLAATIDQALAFERLPILADALMDAGCDCEEIIAHCRGGGTHVRGCWAVELVLERQLG